MNKYKRQYRELAPETKKKISNSNKNKPKSDMVKQKISQGMLKYWASVPHRPENNNDV